jgi:hypothetical protein
MDQVWKKMEKARLGAMVSTWMFRRWRGVLCAPQTLPSHHRLHEQVYWTVQVGGSSMYSVPLTWRRA